MYTGNGGKDSGRAALFLFPGMDRTGRFGSILKKTVRTAAENGNRGRNAIQEK